MAESESKVQTILQEWQEGCFYEDEYMSDAYTTLLTELLSASPLDLQDTRLPAFLQAGYEAYGREQGNGDPQATLTYRMALAMIGRGNDEVVPDTPRPDTPPPRTPSPQPGPSRTTEEGEEPDSPQPGPSGVKRGREEGDGAVEQPTLEVVESTERELKRFKSKFREERMLIRGLGSSLPSEELMEGLFDTVLRRQREAVDAKDDDRAILEIQSTENNDNPLWFSMRQTNQFNGRVVLDKLSRLLNSNKSFLADGKLKISYVHIPTPNAGGRNKRHVANETTGQWLERFIASSTIFSPDNPDDNLCLTRCIAIAKAHGTMSRQAFYKLKRCDLMQRKVALKLCEKGQLDANKPCGLDEVRKLQDALPEYRLCVFTSKDCKDCVFKGEYAPHRKNIYLLLHEEHFYCILYPCQAFCRIYVCDKCVVFFNHKGEHKCEGSCWRCLGPDVHDDPTLTHLKCSDCKHTFHGDECFQRHKNVNLPRSDKTKCDVYKFCTFCNTSYSTLRGREHKCGFVYCKFCKRNVLENHLCYMQEWQPREKSPKKKYVTIVYDIETTQCDPHEGSENIFVHKPNLLVSQATCDECCHIPQNEYYCTVCKNRQQIFHCLDDPSINVMSQFIHYLQGFSSKTDLLLIAHNAKGYDAVFVLQELIARKIKPDLVLQGCKILCMESGNWKFIDSLLFLAMPLSALPKSFGLRELCKGWWPYLANKPEYYTYEGPLLSKEFYCVDSMNKKASHDFHTWYDQLSEQNYVFNFRRELIDYCISDVTILRQATQAFRKLFETYAGFDPMFHCITLSSACMAAFRHNFLMENKIGLVPIGGYHGRGNQSHSALQWLDYESYKLGRVILTIYSHREVTVLGRRVDGYIEIRRDDGSIEKRIYQFHGCYFHQCIKHFPADASSPENRYEKTMHTTAMFRNAGYTVIEKWECDFNVDLQSDPEVKAYFEANPTKRQTPLSLRDAICGGRTSALAWAHKADVSQGERINFYDITSEYPAANLFGKYPYGHPKIYLQGDPEMPSPEKWNGVVKCTVVPPRDIFIPVLPYKSRGKLMFPLCRSCVESESADGLCKHHDPEERQLTGTWCTPEIEVAMQEGYQLIECHELYQYPGTMIFNAETGENGLLSAYVRCFMALKIQASGWPPEITTENQKKDFVADTLKYDGITIDETKMEFNPALRTLSKAILNSFWGKMAERTLRPKTALVYDYANLISIVTDPQKKVSGLLPLSEDCLQVTWKPIVDSDESLPTSSLVHGAFTTCFGRLQLFKYLKMVGKRALYHDTDSVAYISRPGEPDLPLGTHLGDLVDQIAQDYGPGSFITEFAAGGPKNYGYKVAVGGDIHNIKTCIKVRGISINKSCDDIVSYDNLKAMVMGTKAKINVPIARQIARLPTWIIVTRSTSKQWQAINTKRRRLDQCHTVPHGYNAYHDENDDDQELMGTMDLLADS